MRYYRLLVFVVAIVASVALIASAGTMSRATPGKLTANASSAEGVPGFGNVFLIIGENTELGQLNKQNAPFTLGELKPRSAWLTHYFAVTHFSEANYIAMTSGQYTHCQQFDGSAASCHQDVNNLFNQLDAAGISWKSWMESMPEPCTLTNTGSKHELNHYAAKHNPAIFYDDIEGAGGAWSATNRSAECLANDVPAGSTGPNDMSAFNHALASGDVARFNLVVPNECEDAHDNCSPPGNEISQFDRFLAREIPLIEHSPAFGDDGVIIVTFDEGTSNRGPESGGQFANGGNVAFIVDSPLAKPGVYGGTFTHYSLLRTLEDGYGIGNHLANASNAAPINTIWSP